MSPIVISIIVFAGVTALIGAVAFVMRGKSVDPEERLAAFTAVKSQAGTGEPHVEIWKKAAFDNDRKALLEQLVPNIPSLQRIFEQAECNVPPSTLMGIALVGGVLGASASWLMGVPFLLLPLPALVVFSLPWLWLWNKRRSRLKAFAGQLPDALELVAREVAPAVTAEGSRILASRG